MTTSKSSILLKVSLVIFIIVAVFYGITYLFVPQMNVQASGGDPVPSGWLRWVGGIILGIGICAILVLKKPRNQGIFISTLALGLLLSGLALLYSAFFEPEGIGNLLHTYIPGVVQIILSILFWISLKQSKKLLFSE